MNRTTGETLAARARVARGLWAQIVGFIGRRDIGDDEALGLPNCAAVHTLFVRQPLDVVFCDAGGRVLRVAAHVHPGRIAGCRGTGASVVMAWEARAGVLAPRVRPGDVLALVRAAETEGKR